MITFAITFSFILALYFYFLTLVLVFMLIPYFLCKFMVVTKVVIQIVVQITHLFVEYVPLIQSVNVLSHFYINLYVFTSVFGKQKVSFKLVTCRIKLKILGHVVQLFFQKMFECSSCS